MKSVEDYRNTLRALYGWDDYLRRNSGLPGSRANLELMEAVVLEGTTERFFELLRWTPDRAAEDTPESFLAMAGAAGLGERVARGERGLLARMRMIANDPRWRVREGIAFGLQHLGGEDMGLLLSEMRAWSRGRPLERRAAVAAVAEPRLLDNPDDAAAAVDLTDRITATLLEESSHGDSDVRALRQTLGYAWSVLISEAPNEAKKPFERWVDEDDSDIRWLVRENLRKKRLQEAEPEWTAKMLARIGEDAAAEKVMAAAAARAARPKASKPAAAKAATAKEAAKKAAEERPAKAASAAGPAKGKAAKGKAAKTKAAARKSAPARKPTPRKATPRKATPRKATPRKATPRKATPKKATPRKATPRKPTPRKATPKKAAPKKAAPKKAAPKKATPRKATPKKAAPKKAAGRGASTKAGKKATAKKSAKKTAGRSSRKPSKKAARKPARKAAGKRTTSKKPGRGK